MGSYVLASSGGGLLTVGFAESGGAALGIGAVNDADALMRTGTDIVGLAPSTAGNVMKSTGSAWASAALLSRSAEISALTEKAAPVGADNVLIEDSAAANAKKRVQLANLPVVETGGAVLHPGAISDHGAIVRSGTSLVSIAPGALGSFICSDGTDFQCSQRAKAYGATSPVDAAIANTTAAAAGAQQYSGRLALLGSGWSTDAGGASMVAGFGLDARPVQGAAAPTCNLVLGRNINGSWTDLIQFTSAGSMTMPGGGSITCDNTIGSAALEARPGGFMGIGATQSYGAGYLSLTKDEVTAGAVAAVLGNVPTDYTFGGWLKAWRSSDAKQIAIPYFVAP